MISHPLLAAMLLMGAAVSAPGDPASLLADPVFDAYREDNPGRWQVRYAIKTSEPDSRPRWRAVPRTDAADAGRGQTLYLEKTGAAAGAVYIGQSVRLPDPLPASLEFSVEFQTYCEIEGRSGEVTLSVFSPEAWGQLAADPETAGQPLEEALFSQTVHTNREDVTAWRTGRAVPTDLRAALARHAGQEVVVAVVWSTWHPSSVEWARFGSLWLGEPRPSIEAVAWPRFAYPDEPLVLSVLAVGTPPEAVTLQYRPVGQEGTWQSAPLAVAGEGRLAGSVPAAALTGPLQVRAVLRAGGTEMATPTVEVGMTRRPTHPNLFYNAAEIARMRAKAREFEWAGQIMARLRRGADAWLESPADPPAEPGGWSHDYTCPADGARLSYRDDQPHKHLCPNCKQEWEGPKLDASWRGTRHTNFSTIARDLALVYQLTGEERYARAAARILVWYADHYAGFPLGKGPAGRGKVMSQSLSECTWLIRMMEAADLAYPALTLEERRHIERDLIYAGAEHISHYTFGLHNVQCWHNACLACAGYFLGDPDLVRRAREGALGFDVQVEQGILEDGMWYERSLGYHSYTRDALTAHCEAARHAGENLHQIGRIRRMFTLPLLLAQPNLVLPSLNDQGYTRGRIAAEPLERAVAWYGDEDAARALKLLLDQGVQRSSLTALQYGEELPDTGAYRPPASADLPGSGLAILRRGAGADAACAMLEYGEHGGGHGHLDKLQLILYGLGRTLCPDPGTAGYGVPLHRQWFKTTAAHNTVTIGARPQAATTGKLLAFEANERYAAATAESREAYPGTRMVRRLLLGDGFLVDLFAVAGEAPKTLDWFLRAPGELTLSLETTPLVEKAPNATYAYLKDLRAAKTDQTWSAIWQVDDGGGRLVTTMRAAPETQVAHCLAPGIPGEAPWQTLRVRREASATQFVAVHQCVPAGGEPRPVVFAADRVSIGNATVRFGETIDAALTLDP